MGSAVTGTTIAREPSRIGDEALLHREPPGERAAIDAAADGAGVILDPRMHRIDRPIRFRGKAIALRSSVGADALMAGRKLTHFPARESIDPPRGL